MMRVRKNDNFDFYYIIRWCERFRQILIEYKCCLEMYLYFEMSFKSDVFMLDQVSHFRGKKKRVGVFLMGTLLLYEFSAR